MIIDETLLKFQSHFHFSQEKLQKQQHQVVFAKPLLANLLNTYLQFGLIQLNMPTAPDPEDCKLDTYPL